MYGNQIPSEYGPIGVVGEPETSAVGNLVLRVGRLHAVGTGWHQTEHVVLTPDEGFALVEAIMSALGRPPGSASRP